MRKITESTLIPISLAITIVGGAGFVTFVYWQTAANAREIITLQKKTDAILDMRVDIGIIKTKVESIEKKVGP